ncbi:ribonuclease III [Stipitochalara longipes BDJ]|nr:ribonuclease III [Stipitochalara longipes BDJ]
MQEDLVFEDDEPSTSTLRHPMSPYASPLPEAASNSAKLAALHARLALPKKLPLQTMARTLVDTTADPNSRFNNASLAQLGGAITSFHVAEFLLCTYPRLPMAILFAAASAYNGPRTLAIIAQEWGVETAAYPGSEVDPGLLQFSKLKPGTKIGELGSVRRDTGPWRRGMSSRVVLDDEFGDTIPKPGTEVDSKPTENAYSNFVKAVVGGIYVHAGREAAKKFVREHILSRHLEITQLFEFKDPVRELAVLCKREEFEYPVARILSETGRMSRSPVFVVGIYSGHEKLGEGAGASLAEARIRASVAALKAWYLYSPGNNVRVPSDVEGANTKPWEPVHIDIGEIIH